MAMVVQLHEGVAINTFRLNKPRLRIGRDPSSDIYIDNSVISFEHAVIEAKENPKSAGKPEYYIEDLKSTNNTFVNGEKITRNKRGPEQNRQDSEKLDTGSVLYRRGEMRSFNNISFTSNWIQKWISLRLSKQFLIRS